MQFIYDAGARTKYHTNSPEYSHREVHHNHENCPDGKRIKKEHRIEGDGGKPLCKECQKLP
jgi:hypothetical protein